MKEHAMESHIELWNLVREELKANLSEVIFNVWLSELELISLDGSRVVLSIGEFKRRIVEQKFLGVLKDAFEKVMGFSVEVSLIDASGSEAKKEQLRQSELEIESKQFENTFKTFVVGSSNKFAHAAATAVAANPGNTYNPLFIYGNSGLGKTHLLNAICHEILQNDPSVNYVIIHGEDFTNELVTSLANKSMSKFREKYRNLDLLIVDDVQFIAGRDASEEEFFHTYNALTDKKKQIVLSSDRPPKEILSLTERLRTRFEWGLLADIQPPDLETRMAIVKQKAEGLGFEIPDDVVQFVAEKLRNNIRQLESAVKKLQAFVIIHGAPLNTITAQNAIKDILNDIKPLPVTIDNIIAEVARTFGGNAADIRSKKRDALSSKMRKVAMYVVNEITDLSKEAIGKEFGGRDHSTVIYNLQEIGKMIEKDRNLAAMVNDIIKNVQEG
ncbi:MAG TPA: chromosomal replication initiator protein DnaA [Clostridiales bacterium]|nr:chromosomal replication initiator protein DnaA [Clostridiales bacterium]